VIKKNSWMEIVLKTGGIVVFVVVLGTLKQTAPVAGQNSASSLPPDINADQPSDPNGNYGSLPDTNSNYQYPASDSSQNQSSQPNSSNPQRSRTHAS